MKNSQLFVSEEKRNRMDRAEWRGYVNYRRVSSLDLPQRTGHICQMKYNEYKVTLPSGYQPRTPLRGSLVETHGPAPTWSIPSLYHKDLSIT